MYKKIILITLLITIFSISASAQSYFCSRPDKPYCVDSFQRFRDQSEFENCKFEVEEYLNNIREYVECLEREKADAINESEAVIQSFNNRAR